MEAKVETSMYSKGDALEARMDPNEVFETLSCVVKQITGNTTRILLKDLGKVMKNEGMKEHLDIISPYMYAAGFLVFACRPISAGNIGGVMKAMGIEPKREIAQLLCDAGMSNCILYVYTVYFLMIMGRAVNKKGIMDVMASLNEPFDEQLAEYAISLYESKQIP